MKVNEIKHQAKLQEWHDNILDCRSNGIAVSRWCEEHHVHPTTYYKWEREIFGGVGKGLVMGERQAVAPIFAELPVPRGPSHFKPDAGVIATVHFETTSVDIYTGTDIDVVASLFKLLRYAE